IIFPGSRHIPFATLSPEAARDSLTCIAPSKTFNVAGLASSVVIIPDPVLRHRFQEALEGLELGMTNTFGLVAREACYQHGEAWLEELMQYLSGNLACIESYLAKRLPRVKMIPPEGTYLAWLDCRSLRLPQAELDQRLVDAGLGLSSGTLYGPQGEGFQRLNFACPRSLLEEGLSRLEVALGSH
ncbi:MAG: cystathionine beta-lyase, partial [Coprothermobacterota bacterium]|nr:cystathionine beta-lyase [Coprothermobacterota bacterium]